MRGPFRGSFLPPLFVAVLAGVAPAQQRPAAGFPDLGFEEAALDGLPEGVAITSVARDDAGRVWLGTGIGLFGYDGLDVVHERSDPEDADSLVHDAITLGGIVVDRQGALWVPTQRGLSRYAEGRFQSFHFEPDPVTGDEIVGAVHESSDGTIWAGTATGLHRFDPESSEFERVALGLDEPLSIITALAEDENGALWVGTRRGLVVLDSEGRVESLRHDPADPTSPPHDDVFALHVDRRGEIWVGTLGGGVFTLGPVTRECRRRLRATDEPSVLPTDQVLSISEDADGLLWIGTWGGGLVVLDPRTGNARIHRADVDDPDGLSADQVYDVEHDANGLAWVATRAGIDRVTRRQPFVVLSPRSGPARLSRSRVSAVVEDAEGALWIGTAGGGVDRVAPDRASVDRHRHDPARPDSLASDDVSALEVDPSGRLWVGTLGGGLARLDPGTDSFVRVRADAGSGLRSDFVRDLLVGPEQRLWIATVDAGLACYDLSSDAFVTRVTGGAGLGRARLTASCIGPDGALWLGTATRGLLRIEPGAVEPESFRHDPDRDDSLSSDRVTAIAATDGRIWIGTAGGGLCSCDPRAGGFVRFGELDGLASDDVRSLEVGDDGAVWVGTTDGLTRVAVGGGERGELTSFRVADGLPSASFLRGSSARLASGELAFGTNAGLVLFDPRELDVDTRPTEMSVMGAYVGEDALSPSNGALELDWTDDDLRFRFAVLDHRSPASNRTSYRLRGVDADWRTAGAGHEASYPALPPGAYVFEVRGAGSNGVWSDTRSLSVVVHPPVTQTWWFRSVVALAIALVAFIAHFLRTRSMRERSVALQAEIDERRHAEAERARLEDELRQSQKLEAVGQLTGGIAHDFNNLLTAVIGNLELAGGGDVDADTAEFIDQASEAAQRGAELTQRLLSFSRRRPMEPKVVDPARLVRGMSNLVRRSLEASVEIRIVAAPDLWMCRVDPSQLENAVLNLALNARDAMGGHGTLTIELANVSVGAGERRDLAAGDYVALTVADDGPGMSEETRRRAFEPFFTTKAVGEGSGLGLSMVYGFARQSGGLAEIESVEGEGATVRVLLSRADGPEERVGDVARPEPILTRGDLVLVVEDDEAVRRTACELLGSIGYRVLAASSGPEALEQIERGASPALLLSDVVLPGGMDGFELVRTIRERTPTTRALLMSGYPGSAGYRGAAGDAALLGSVPILAKPFRRVDLAKAVDEVFSRPAPAHASGVGEGEVV